MKLSYPKIRFYKFGTIEALLFVNYEAWTKMNKYDLIKDDW